MQLRVRKAAYDAMTRQVPDPADDKRQVRVPMLRDFTVAGLTLGEPVEIDGFYVWDDARMTAEHFAEARKHFKGAQDVKGDETEMQP